MIIVQRANKQQDLRSTADSKCAAHQALLACENGAVLKDFGVKDLLTITSQIVYALPADPQDHARIIPIGRTLVDLAISREDCKTAASVIWGWAECQKRMNRWKEHLAVCKEALAFIEKCPGFAGTLRTELLRSIALSPANESPLSQKEILLKQSLYYAELDRHPPPYLLAECNLLVASNLLEQKKFKEARSYFDKTLKLYRSYKTKPGMAGDVFKKLEDYLKQSQTLGDTGSYSAMQKDVESLREHWLYR